MIWAWAKWRSLLLDPFGGDADGIAATFHLAFSLEHPGCLFLLPIRRPAIIGPTVDIQPGMGQGTESSGKVFETLLQQDTGQGMNHLALQSDFDRSGPVELAVFGIDRHHDMNEFMHEDAKTFDRLRLIRSNEDFEMVIGGG